MDYCLYSYFVAVAGVSGEPNTTAGGGKGGGTVSVKEISDQGPSFSRPWDYMILTVWMAFSPKGPMYKNSETVCIHSPKYSLYICV